MAANETSDSDIIKVKSEEASNASDNGTDIGRNRRDRRCPATAGSPSVVELAVATLLKSPILTWKSRWSPTGTTDSPDDCVAFSVAFRHYTPGIFKVSTFVQ